MKLDGVISRKTPKMACLKWGFFHEWTRINQPAAVIMTGCDCSARKNLEIADTSQAGKTLARDSCFSAFCFFKTNFNTLNDGWTYFCKGGRFAEAETWGAAAQRLFRECILHLRQKNTARQNCPSKTEPRQENNDHMRSQLGIGVKREWGISGRRHCSPPCLKRHGTGMVLTRTRIEGRSAELEPNLVPFQKARLKCQMEPSLEPSLDPTFVEFGKAFWQGWNGTRSRILSTNQNPFQDVAAWIWEYWSGVLGFSMCSPHAPQNDLTLAHGVCAGSQPRA